MSGDERHLARAVRGPITLITIGALFALNNFTPYGFGQTWPVLLIVFGLLSLLGRGMAPTPPPRPMAPPDPQAGPPHPSGSYRQSQYPGPPAGGAPGQPGGSQ